MSLRHRLALELDPGLKHTPGLSILNKIIIVVILCSLLLAIIETERTIYLHHERIFMIAEWVFTTVFAIEYIARVWVSIENPKYVSRFRFMLTPATILDLLTVLLILLTTMGTEGFILRLARLLRVLRIAKLGRYSVAMQNIGHAIYLRRFELIISFGIGVCALIISSSLLYIVEGDMQPEYFGSIPRAMWWSVATLTTVGYGDVYPVTALGRFFAAITAVVGIGLIAMPTGILAASFSDAIQTIKKNHSEKE
ncbi:potassium channel family protein [Legionella shakespearei]|uniref:Cyclic nucleotide-gated potassium channel n=1 Tax=Legionella shakespearei DSM 23087 TaxID=1122169 RepID=A0A0W0YLP2_9GAMM|nr:potassium channel family protein [Legionella shakespearei]KTD57739.1 Cyclic nucleotide-gated potassium channel [Legionella shakespearei DSM 23087]